jgi:type IV secretion system protein VirB11
MHIHLTRRTAAGATAAAFNRSGAAAALREKLAPLEIFLADSTAQTICINRPGEVFVRTASGWTRHEVASLSLRWCEEFLTFVPVCTSRPWRDDSAFLSAMLSSGNRIHVVAPPAVGPGTLSITIDKNFRFGEIDPGFYKAARSDEMAHIEQRLRNPENDAEFWGFYSAAIAARKNVVIVDPNGSSSSTFRQACADFVPRHERILVIGAGEAPVLTTHPNCVHVSYAAEASVLVPALVRACRRMRPDRILLTQMRPQIAHAYVSAIASHWRGCVTTVQASSCDEAMERMAEAIRASETGRALPRSDVTRLLRSAFEVVVQFHAVETHASPLQA